MNFATFRQDGKQACENDWFIISDSGCEITALAIFNNRGGTLFGPVAFEVWRLSMILDTSSAVVSERNILFITLFFK